MPTFDMRPVEVAQEVLDGLKSIPSVTVYSGVRNFGSALCVCEGLANLTPGRQRFAARARTLRFLPLRPDLASERTGGDDRRRRRTGVSRDGTLRTGRCPGGGHHGFHQGRGGGRREAARAGDEPCRRRSDRRRHPRPGRGGGRGLRADGIRPAAQLPRQLGGDSCRGERPDPVRRRAGAPRRRDGRGQRRGPGGAVVDGGGGAGVGARARGSRELRQAEDSLGRSVARPLLSADGGD